MAVDFWQWLEDHIYVPILVGCFVVICLAVLICCLVRRCRRQNRYKMYERISEYDMEVAVRMEMDREQRQNQIRHTAFMQCQFYIRAHPRFDSSVIQQMHELGSRIGKHWFRVRDNKTGQERLLSILPHNKKMPLAFSRATSKALRDLFIVTQHPFLFPMCEFDLDLQQDIVVVVEPICVRGSLKDVIYMSKFGHTWFQKYNHRSKGLQVSSIRKYGRQILEALLYMEGRDFPSHGNVHSGNVMVENGVCRLSGYENCFLGNTSRLHGLIKRKLKDDKSAIDSISFGHLLFEMTAGFELDTAHPEPGHLAPLPSDILEVLNFIFSSDDGKYPTIREIAEHPFFQKVFLAELESFNPCLMNIPDNIKSLLKAVKSGKKLKTKSGKRRRSRTSSLVEEGKTESLAYSSPPPPPPPPPAPPAPGGPPAPPPPPPPPSSSSSMAPPPSPSTGSGGRSALLSSIRKGTTLRKAVTNDRSAPKV